MLNWDQNISVMNGIMHVNKKKNATNANIKFTILSNKKKANDAEAS